MQIDCVGEREGGVKERKECNSKIKIERDQDRRKSTTEREN